MIICVNCGKVVSSSAAKGSLKHPYCFHCWNLIWADDYQAYNNWLEKHHPYNLSDKEYIFKNRCAKTS